MRSSVRILCDENIPNHVVHYLRQRGFRIVPFRAGSADAEIARQARRHRAILLTFDSDFANILQYPPSWYYGIVRCKCHPPLPETMIPMLAALFLRFRTSAQFKGKLIILEPTAIRVWEGTVRPRGRSAKPS